MFSIESPHRGESKEYTQHTILNMNKKINLKLSQICSYRIFSTVVNLPSVLEPLKGYCIKVELQADLIYMMPQPFLQVGFF